MGPWQLCPVTCGEGAFRKRSVMCVSSSRSNNQPELALPDHDCNMDARPKEIELCLALFPCGSSSETPVIIFAEQKNSASENINLYDHNSGSNTIDGLHGTEIKSEILEFNDFDDAVISPYENSINNVRPKWQVSKWSHCVAGMRTREVSCSVVSVLNACNSESKPHDTEECSPVMRKIGKYSSVMLPSQKLIAHSYI